MVGRDVCLTSFGAQILLSQISVKVVFVKFLAATVLE